MCVIDPFQSSVCGKILELLGQNKIDHHQRQVAILSQDSFYKVLTPEQKAKALKGQFNFDHPGWLGFIPKSPPLIWHCDYCWSAYLFVSQAKRDHCGKMCGWCGKKSVARPLGK